MKRHRGNAVLECPVCQHRVTVQGAHERIWCMCLPETPTIMRDLANLQSISRIISKFKKGAKP